MKKIYSLLCSVLIASIALIGCESEGSLGGDDSISISAPTITGISTAATNFTFTLTAPANSSKYGYVVVEGSELEDIAAIDILDKTLATSAKSIGVYDTENLSKKEVYIGGCTPGATYYIYAAAVSGTSYSEISSDSADIVAEDAPTITLTVLDKSPYGFAFSVVPSENTFKYAYALFKEGTEAPEAENFFNEKIENSVNGLVNVLSITQAPKGANSVNVASPDTKYVVYAVAITEVGTYSEIYSMAVGTDPQVTTPMADGVELKEGIYNIAYSKTVAATEENNYQGVTNEKSGEPFECRLFQYVSGILDGKRVNLYLLQAKWFNITMESNGTSDNTNYLEPYLLGVQTDNVVVFNGMLAVMGTDPSDKDTYNKLYVAADQTGTAAASAFGGIIASNADGEGLAFFGGGMAGMESIAITIDANSGEAKEITELSIVHTNSSSYAIGTYDIVVDGTMSYVKENDPSTIPDTYETPENFFGPQSKTKSIVSSSFLHKISSKTILSEKVEIIK